MSHNISHTNPVEPSVQTTHHSRAKLALALFTSPKAAYEEIFSRTLLGTGLLFVGATGVLFCIRACLAASVLGPLHYFAVGRYNPIAWFGLFLLYAWATQKLLKWVGTEIEFDRLVTIMGWAQISLAIVAVASIIGLTPSLSGNSAKTASQFIDSVSAVLQIAYVVLIGIGINMATRAPTARGIMTYVVVSFAGTIAFGITYGNSRLKLFADALPGIAGMAQQVAASDGTPWLAAAVFGLYLGLRDLGRALGWTNNASLRTAISAALVGALGFGVYLLLFLQNDFYGRLINAQRDYELGKAAHAVKELKSLLPASKYASAGLILDIADIYYISKKPALARKYYRRFEALVNQARLTKDEERKQLARPLSGIGAAYDQEGKYEPAIKMFDRATKLWPEFRDPWVRLAVTYNRLGKYTKALEYAEHATKKLKSEAPALYVAMVQAYACLNNRSAAEKAYKELRRLDDQLADRIGKTMNEWRTATAKLTPKDLKFPLEKEVVPRPERASRRTPKESQR
ncbi:MAG: tetratricopeptide repeat protein [Armatimonadota bacterium]|nr:tetratricopeptide repeat protein [Armatimonadota bacterium]